MRADLFTHHALHATPHATFTVICPGIDTEITPPQIQFKIEVLFRAGAPPIITVGEPGDQGAGVTGTQGTGVRTPMAAEVAAATAGFVGVVHIPNGITLTIGAFARMFAAGILLVFTRVTGKTVRLLGATPNVHIIIAPLQTSCAILSP
jgi:hypothetical protein